MTSLRSHNTRELEIKARNGYSKSCHLSGGYLAIYLIFSLLSLTLFFFFLAPGESRDVPVNEE